MLRYMTTFAMLKVHHRWQIILLAQRVPCLHEFSGLSSMFAFENAIAAVMLWSAEVVPNSLVCTLQTSMQPLLQPPFLLYHAAGGMWMTAC